MGECRLLSGCSDYSDMIERLDVSHPHCTRIHICQVWNSHKCLAVQYSLQKDLRIVTTLGTGVLALVDSLWRSKCGTKYLGDEIVATTDISLCPSRRVHYRRCSCIVHKLVSCDLYHPHSSCSFRRICQSVS